MRPATHQPRPRALPPPPHSHARAALLHTLAIGLQEDLGLTYGHALLVADSQITRVAALGLDCVAEGCWAEPGGPEWVHLWGGLVS